MRPNFDSLNAFTQQYMTTALWSSNDESNFGGGVPLDQNYGYDDISDETVAAMVEDCDRFLRDHAADVELAVALYPQRNDSTGALGSAGHDFWLTRNGHGAGFWDGDLPEELGDRLTRASENCGEVNLYVGDDGRVYH